MLTTTFECQPEPYDADANLYNRSLPELNSNRMHPNIGFGEHGQVASSASASSTPSTMDDSIHSPGSVQHEVESVLARNGQPELLPLPYLPAGSGNFEQIQRHQQGQLQEQYAQRLLQDARQRQVQGQWQFQQVPNLVVLSCAVCTSPTVQLCEGCTSVGYCSRDHQMKDWSRHSKDCHSQTRSTVRAGSLHMDSERKASDIAMDRYTPGKVFEVDAILIPVDDPLPRLVKAAFIVELDEAQVTLRHHERCFNELLGEAAPWVNDGQLDEDTRMHMQPQSQMQMALLQPSANANAAVFSFSLHCRPNGQPNRCYEALVSSFNPNANNVNTGLTNSNTSNLASLGCLGQRGTFSSGAFDTADPSLQEDKHLRGNGSFLVLKHPPGTRSPQQDGVPVLDATLADLKLVVPYLRQRFLQRRNVRSMLGQAQQPGMQFMVPMKVGTPSFNPQPTGFPGGGDYTNTGFSSQMQNTGLNSFLSGHRA